MLILGGISGAGITTLLQDYRPIFLVATFGLLGSAFYFTYRPSWRAKAGAGGAAPTGGRSRVMMVNKIMLWVVATVSIGLLCFPQAMIRPLASSDELIAEMHHTVIQIEGMT